MRMRAGLAALMLASCASYQPKPLDLAPVPLVDGAAITGRQVPWTMEEIAALAVAHDPDLVAARAARGADEASILAAGILPNPSLSLSDAFVLSGPGAVAAWSVGISQDVKSLLTYRSRQVAAKAGVRQADADLVWQEWQVIGLARLLVVDLVEGARLRGELAGLQVRLEERLARSRAGLAEGQQTVADVATDLAAASDGAGTLADLDRKLAGERHDLALLLGLPPDAGVRLAGNLAVPEVSEAEIGALREGIADRRPDLIALRFGYQAQDATLRGQILAQFPALALGLTRAKDNTGVQSVGPDVTMDLPIFDRNQGGVAVARATREQLYAEFEARLAAARSQIVALADDQDRLWAELARARADRAALGAVSDGVDRALRAGDLDERAAVEQLAAQSARAQAVILTEQSLLEQQVALATLTGAGMPAVKMELP
jgi:outer membrane protein TolC